MLNREIIFHDILQYRVFLYLGWESIQFIASIDDNDVIKAKAFGSMNSHEFQPDTREFLTFHSTSLFIVYEICRPTEVICIKSVTAKQQD